MSWLTKLKSVFSKSNLDRARALLINATNTISRAVSAALQDEDLNGLPDHAESIARQAGIIVASLEVIRPSIINGPKLGKERFEMAKAAFLATSGATLSGWLMVEPYIEGAVALINKRAKGEQEQDEASKAGA